jgi:response regulator RpfG family c-di-GMP phosphodiesterase
MTSLEMNNETALENAQPTLNGSHILTLAQSSSPWPSLLESNGARISLIEIGGASMEFINSNEVDLILIDLEEQNPLAYDTVLAIQKTGQSLPIIALLENEDESISNLIPCLPRQGKSSMIIADILDAIGHNSQITSLTRLNEIYKGNETIVRSALSVIKTNLESEINNYIKAVLSRSVSEIMYAAHRVRPIASLLGVLTLETELRQIEENAISLTSKDLHACAMNSIRVLRRIQREMNHLYS